MALDHVEISPTIAIFRRMIRGLEFDVSEMALSTYLCARAHGKPITAIPVFLTRGFHHGAIMYNTNSGITSPSDLAGRRVGVRGYTVTTGVWVRGILQTQYGVDLSTVTWVLSGDEHVPAYVAPPNVMSAAGEANLAAMLVSGEIDAAIGVGNVESPHVQPLIPDARKAGIGYFERTGVYPINHTLAVRDDVLAANPWLAEELFTMFRSAKETYMQKLTSDGPQDQQDHAMMGMKDIIGENPLPYGVGANQNTLECFIQFNVDQKVIPEAISVDEAFATSTLKLE